MIECMVLFQELEEVSSNLIKVKMSSVRLDKNPSPTGREQRIQQLHQKLNMVNDNHLIVYASPKTS